jgi:uncharacterized membrane protein
MLSDAEQRRLTQIESLLRATDPVFVHRFNDRWRKPRRWRLLAMFAISVSVLMIVFGIAVGSVITSVIGLTAAGAAFGAWLDYRTATGFMASEEER